MVYTFTNYRTSKSEKAPANIKMQCLKYPAIVLLQLSSIFFGVRCVFERQINEHGIFEPVIDIETANSMPDSIRKTDESTDTMPPPMFTARAEELPMDHLIRGSRDKTPIFFYIDRSIKLDNADHIYNFRLNKFTSTHGENSYYAIELPARPCSNRFSFGKKSRASPDLDTSAYFLVQGRFIDIPIHPAPNQPSFVFTPPFSGCSLVVDLMERTTNNQPEKFYRVYHVEGRKENQQYNDLSDHGYGMVEIMQYKQYGYHFDTDRHRFLENVLGIAFMKYSQQHNTWLLYQQNQYVPNNPYPPTVRSISVKNGVKQIEAILPQRIKCVSSNFEAATLIDHTWVQAKAAATSSKLTFVAEVTRDLEREREKSKSEQFYCI